MAKKLIVAKFGGTSVLTPENREKAASRIAALRETGAEVVSVISAMGRMGAPYATDTLLSLVQSKADKRATDLLASCGETIAVCVMADVLVRHGIPAYPMNASTAGIHTDSSFTNAKVIGMDPKNVLSTVHRGIVPVITGFQGVSPSGEMTTLGRGGSDTSAVEIGGYIGADLVMLFTDVKGVASADPRVVPDARYMKAISYDDMLLLSDWGSKVVHPRAVRAAVQHKVPVHVLSTFDDAPGTIVQQEARNPGLVCIAEIKGCSKAADDASLVWSDKRYNIGGGDTAIITVLFHDVDEQTVLAKHPEAEVDHPHAGSLVMRLVVPDPQADDLVRRLYADFA